MGCNAGKGGEAVGMSDGTRAAPVNLRPPQQLHPNSGQSALKRLTERFIELGIAYAPGGLCNERDRGQKQ
jgi:hypothetical protein